MDDRTIPQESQLMDAVHFQKGCYLGQEIVERIRSRGNVHRHLRQLELNGSLAAPGTELLLDGTAIGHITSAAELSLQSGGRSFALAMIRSEAEVKNQPLTYEGGTAMLLPQPPAL